MKKNEMKKEKKNGEPGYITLNLQQIKNKNKNEFFYVFSLSLDFLIDSLCVMSFSFGHLFKNLLQIPGIKIPESTGFKAQARHCVLKSLIYGRDARNR